MYLKDIDLKELYRKWRKNAKELKPFIRSTPFVSLQTYDNFKLNNMKDFKESEFCRFTAKAITEKYNEDIFIIVDLNLNHILDIAFILNKKENIWPLININLLFHPFGLIGNKEDINKLVYYGNNLENCENKYIMYIPYDRYDNSIDVSKLTRKLNNQYELGCEDLPYIETLKQLGYKKVLAVTYEEIKEDFNGYLEYLSEGMSIEKLIVKDDKEIMGGVMF